MKKLDKEIKRKLIRYVRAEHSICTLSRTIMLGGGVNRLSDVDVITQDRIRVLMTKENYRVYSQPTLF